MSNRWGDFRAGLVGAIRGSGRVVLRAVRLGPISSWKPTLRWGVWVERGDSGWRWVGVGDELLRLLSVFARANPTGPPRGTQTDSCWHYGPLGDFSVGWVIDVGKELLRLLSGSARASLIACPWHPDGFLLALWTLGGIVWWVGRWTRCLSFWSPPLRENGVVGPIWQGYSFSCRFPSFAVSLYHENKLGAACKGIASCRAMIQTFLKRGRQRVTRMRSRNWCGDMRRWSIVRQHVFSRIRRMRRM